MNAIAAMIENLSAIFNESSFVDIQRYHPVFLHNSIKKRMEKTGCDCEDTYCELLNRDVLERQLLLESLNVSYSAFFRYSLTWAVLDHLVLPALIRLKQQNREIRIWSLACAAGQEPYSLAMLLEEHQQTMNEKWRYRIFATDRDASEITRAKEGRYHTDSLANVTLQRIDKWFIRVDESYRIKPVLKKHIDFSVFDLFNDTYGCPPESIFGGFDLIIAANLLFYYNSEFQTSIIEKIMSCLADDGLVATGETERDILKAHGFREVYSQSAIFRKGSGGSGISNR